MPPSRLFGLASLPRKHRLREHSPQTTGKQVLLASVSNAVSVCKVPGNQRCSNQKMRGGEGGMETCISQSRTSRYLMDEPDRESESPI